MHILLQRAKRLYSVLCDPYYWGALQAILYHVINPAEYPLIQLRREVFFTKGRIIVRRKPKQSDYILYY